LILKYDELLSFVPFNCKLRRYTKGEVPMMRVVAELMIAANAATATYVHAALPTSVRRCRLD
jgi:hypothetical protein